MLRLSYILLCFCFSITSISGQYLNTVKYSKDDLQLYAGIVGMYEDEEHYLWAYGFDGISRYDGFNFEPIEKIFPESENLISKNCSSIFRDDNFLWIGTSNNGVSAIDKQGQLFRINDLIRNNDSLSSYRIENIFSSGDKLFVVGENGLESFRLRNKKFQKFEIPELDTKSVLKLHHHEGFLWVENLNGLHKIDLQTLDKIQFSYLKNISFFHNPQGELWIASIDEGTTLYQFESISSKFIKADYQPYKNYKKTRGFTWLNSTSLLSTPTLDLFIEIAHFDKNKIERIDAEKSNLDQERFLRTPLTDKYGRTWIFGQEVYVIPKTTGITSHFVSKDIGIVNDMLITENFMYLSIRNKGFYKYDNKGILIQSFTTKNSDLADNFISSIVPLKNDKLGLCMMDYFQIFSEENGFEEAFLFPGIIRTAIENEDHIYLGGYADIFKVNKSTRAVKAIDVVWSSSNQGNAVNAMLSLTDDQLQFATSQGGILDLDTKKDELNTAAFLLNKMVNLKSRHKINDAAISPSGLNIISATDNGLFLIKNEILYDSVKDKRILKNMANLADHERQIKFETNDRFFTNVEFYNDSIAYATSRTQIYRISLNTMSVQNYSRLQGALNKSYILRSRYIDTEGNIYFGGEEGIEKVTESKFNFNADKLNLKIDQIYHNSLPQYSMKKEKHNIPSDAKIVEFKINLPNNLSGNFVKIQGQLDENEWTDLPSNHRLTLYNPYPGSHLISFRAIDQNGGLRSEIVSMRLMVFRKWYEYIWVWIVLGIIITSGIVIGIFNQQKKKNERAMTELRLQKELATLKLTSLNSQMNPHFIFNALSSIQQLVTMGETEIAEDYLSKFSKLLRHVIQYASNMNVGLEEELTFIENYLDLELLRFEDAFDYEIENLVPNPKEVFIPPFFIQPQVENAIKHGFSERDSPYLIKIKLEEINGMVKITIEDNGKGRKFAQGQSVYAKAGTKKGNLLTRERIDNLNKLNYQSSYVVEDLFTDGAPSGTKVTIEFNREKLVEE
jgi:hypothetical protein